MGVTQMHALGLTRNDLLAPILNLRAANTSGIKILGVVFIMITGWDKHGRRWRTHQVVYVSEDVEQLLLSREACVQLGMISSTFPEVGSHKAGDVLSSGVEDNDEVPDHVAVHQGGEGYTALPDVADMILPDEDMDLTPCSPNPDGTCACPRREPPPPPPRYQADLSPSQLKTLILHYGALWSLRIQPMHQADPPHDEGRPHAHHCQGRHQALRCPHPHTGSPALGGAGQVRPGPRRGPRGVGGGAYQHTHHLVSQDGCGSQTEWRATEDSGPPTPQDKLTQTEALSC